MAKKIDNFKKIHKHGNMKHSFSAIMLSFSAGECKM